MGGVDKNDAIVGSYSCIRRTYKWTTKMFFHFLEETVFNSNKSSRKNSLSNKRQR